MEKLNEVQYRFLSELNRACFSSLTCEDSYFLAINPKASLSRLLLAVENGDYLMESLDHKCVLIVNKKVVTFCECAASPLRLALAQLKKIISHAAFQEAFLNTQNLLVIEPGVGEIDFCSSEVQGIKHVYVHGKGNIENALTHELTHALCESGNRFLDEGLAMYMEELVNGDLDDFCLAKSHVTPKATLADYRHAICSQARAGVFLSDHEKYSTQYIDAYYAVRLIAESLEPEVLFSTFSQLKNLNSGLEQFEYLSQKMPTSKVWKRGVSPSLNGANLEGEIIASFVNKEISPTFEQLWLAWFLVPVADLSVEHTVAWCRLWLRYIQIKMSTSKSRASADIANVAYLLNRIKNIERCQADYYLMKAQLESLRLQTAASLEKLSEHAQHYYDYIQKAERLAPDSPKVILESAISDYHRLRQTSDKRQLQLSLSNKMKRLLETPYAPVALKKHANMSEIIR